MESAKYLGRVGGLAIALGTGAWLASVPWLAGAEPTSSGLDLSSLFGPDLSGLLGSAAADPSGLNIDISYNGVDLWHIGDGAHAFSANDGLAIAYGDGATAYAGTYTNPSGPITTGTGDYAFANGADSTAVATGADYSTATASDGGTAYSGIAIFPGSDGNGVSTSPVEFDSASASGAGSVADAQGGSYDSATASGGAIADAGFLRSTIPGIGIFGGGSNDSATASGAGSIAQAGLGNYNTAEVFGNGGTATAGGVEGSPFGASGNFDFAGVFGNGLIANATSGTTNGIVQIATPFGDFAVPEAAAATSAAGDAGLGDLLNDVGLGSLAADFSWLGL